MSLNLRKITGFLNRWNLPITTFVAVAALILGICNTINNCNQNKQMKEINYNDQAVRFKPILTIIGEPVIEKFEFWSDTFDLRKPKEVEDSIKDINVYLNIHFKLSFINTGNSLAKIRAFGCIDTISGGEIIRKWLCDAKLRELYFNLRICEEYYALKEVPIGDTIDMRFEDTINFFTDGEFTMHFIILYVNEIQNLYDTYYWTRYKTIPIVHKLSEYKMIKDTIINGKYHIILESDRINIQDLLRYQDSNSSSRVYSMKEANELKKYFKKKLSGK